MHQACLRRALGSLRQFPVGLRHHGPGGVDFRLRRSEFAGAAHTLFGDTDLRSGLLRARLVACEIGLGLVEPRRRDETALEQLLVARKL